MKKILKFLILFFLLIISFNLILLVGCLFPSSVIQQNVKESSNILLTEGNLYRFFENYDVYNNNYTDSLMINEAYSVDSTHPIVSYMNVRKNYNNIITNEVLSDSLGEATSVNMSIRL